MTKRKDPIKKIELATGGHVYRFSVRVGTKPRIDKATGKPMVDGLGRPMVMADQRVVTKKTRKEAEAERARLLNGKNQGTLIRATKMSVAEMCEAHLAGRRKIRPSTLANYRNAVKPVIERLGHIPLQDLTKSHVDALVTLMLESGRRVGTKGGPLAPGTVTLMLTVLRMVLDDAMKQGLLVRNVAKLVDRPGTGQREMATWTADQALKFLTSVEGDRLGVPLNLSLFGLRRGEVLGLRWDDVDLTGKLAEARGLDPGTPSLSIQVTRIIVDGVVVHSEPKTDRGKRTLPLDKAMVNALIAYQLRQREEAEKAGTAYGSCGDCGAAHVVVDELGDPVHPESYSDRFETLVRRAKLPAIRLHDTRHTCGTLMHLRGVPTAVISAWLGHASAAFTMRTYVHSQGEAMKDAGRMLAAAYSPTA